MTSVMVDDQDKALDFYTQMLGFVKKTDVPVGEYRWLTVVSPASDEVELALEPNVHPAAKVYQKALFEDDIPCTVLAVDDINAEYERLRSLGVVFRGEPAQMGPVMSAIFEDTCGNLLQLIQP